MAKERSTAPSPLILSAHGSPAQSPDQDSSFEIASGRATRRTSLFRGNLELQTSPERHSMPGGVETTPAAVAADAHGQRVHHYREGRRDGLRFGKVELARHSA